MHKKHKLALLAQTISMLEKKEKVNWIGYQNVQVTHEG